MFNRSRGEVKEFGQFPLLFSALVCLLLAIWLYLTKRPSNVLLNVKFDQIFGPEFRWLIGKSTVDTFWPNWIVGSLPAALWLYATNTILILFYPKPRDKNLFAIMLMIFCVLTEFFQYLSFIPGTFDILDAFFYIAFGLIPVVYNEKFCRKN